MCGISGVLSQSSTKDELRHTAVSMADRIAHRGPDAGGIFCSDSGVALAHRRLSILDLSELGAQPMTLGSLTLTYNGEIYNYRELRSELQAQGECVQSEGDTEVLLKSIRAWGLESTLRRIEGMFAFAVWNEDTRELFLVRDRLGQKPLYYGIFGTRLVFASEVKAIEAAIPELRVDLDSVALMLRYKTVPAPRSIYSGLYKLLPGTFLKFRFSDFELSSPKPYWSALHQAWPKAEESEEEAFERFRGHFLKATKKRMVSDVPLGAFLSGGIDSSLVVAAMAASSQEQVKTFTIGFQDERYNEAEQAKDIAHHLGTEHTELYLSWNEVIEHVPTLPQVADEPFGDPSLLPTSLVARLARDQVVVALSGDGGDEFFAGYNRHLWLPRFSSWFSRVPIPVRHLLNNLLGAIGVRRFLLKLQESGLLKVRTLEEKLDKIRFLLNAEGLEAMHRDVLSDWKCPSEIVPAATTDAMDEFRGVPDGLSPIERLCYSDALFYLPEDILFKVDRATMHHSLEGRSPFLDHRLVEFSLGLPEQFKLSGGVGKIFPRKLLAEFVPRELFERPKMGFAIPLSDWLRGPLRDWAQDLLHGDICRSGDYISPDPVLSEWNRHLAGEDRSGRLWNVLMLLAWLEDR